MNNKHNTFGFSTRAIHHGYDPKDHHGALVPPIYLSANFASNRLICAAVCRRSQCHFTRAFQPDPGAAGIAHGDPENGERRWRSAPWADCGDGLDPAAALDEVTQPDPLGCTFALLHLHRRIRIRVRHVDLTTLPPAAHSPRHRMIYCETRPPPTSTLWTIAARGSRPQQPNVTVWSTTPTDATAAPPRPGAVWWCIRRQYLAATAIHRGHCGEQPYLPSVSPARSQDLTGSVMSPQDACC